jgi:hypothetical protein
MQIFKVPRHMVFVGQADVILYVMDGPYRLPFPYCYRTTVAMTFPAANSSCCYIVNVHNQSS